MITGGRRPNKHMSTASPEAIFFDAGETLVHPVPSFPQLFSSQCAAYGLEVDLLAVSKTTRRLMAEVEARQVKGFTFSNHPEKSRRFWLSFYGRLVRELGYEGDDGLAHALYETFSRPENYTAYQDARETLQRLADRGHRLGLISNFEPWLEDLLDELGLSGFFQVMVVSGKERYEKPHPRIYELALRRMGATAEDSLHVGDSPVSDFDGARGVGMRAVLLDRWNRFPDFRGERIESLRELPDLLG
ncbi:MAG: HAD-IA family hydrolase [Actinobacteria bacterium]|nr:HAD-IA family hydrolase [Actinomycetota bacterium]